MKKLLYGFITAVLLSVSFGSKANIDTVLVANFSFTPSSLTLCLGDTIRFVWVSGFHNVHILTPIDSTSNNLTTSGDTYDFTPTSVGAYTYECGIHGSMMSGAFTVNNVPSVNLGADVTQCGGSVMLDAGNAGSTYLWSDASTGQTLSVSATGTYSVVVTNNCGADADTVSITINTIPVVTITGNPNLCAGGSTLLTGAVGGTRQWYLNGQIIPGATNTTYTATVPGVYNMIKTNLSGCSDSAATGLTVILYALPVVNLGADVTQCGGSVPLDAGNPGALYAWSPSGTTQMITALSSGTYSVVVTDGNGCSNSDAVNVTINSVPVINLGGDVTKCGSAFLDAGAGFSSYVWSYGGTDQTITVTATGSYSVSVTVSDANGCTNSDTIMVLINANPTVNLGADVTQCGSTLLDAGNAGSNFMWSDMSTNQTLNVSSSGTYYVDVTDANGCTGTDTVMVTINPIPAAPISGSNSPICAGQTLSLTSNTIGGATYSWSGPNSFTSSLEDPTIGGVTTAASGTYSIAVTVNGCTSPAGTISVTVNANTIVNLGPDTIACGSVMLDAGNAGSIYLWSEGSTTQTITVSVSDTFYVDVTNACGTASDTIVVTINSLPVIATSGNVSICSGGNTMLCATGGLNYSWSTGPTTSCITVSPSATTTYSVTGTDANGCSGMAAVTVNVIGGPSITATSTPASCLVNDGTATATPSGGTPPYFYIWSDGQSTQTATGLMVGSYTVTVTDGNGCSSSMAVNVSSAAAILQTTFAGGNNHRGNMFDVTAISNITVTSVDAHPMANTNYEIYYKAGTYVGSENNAGAWTLAGSATNVIAQPTGTPTPLPIALNINIPAGQTYAMYVTSSNVAVSQNYTNGTAVGNIYAQDANIQIKEGCGIEYPFMNAPFTPRIWNGIIHYCTGPVGTDNVIETVKGVHVYPNPSNGEFTVYGLQSTVQIQIINLYGQVVFDKTVNHKQETINLSEASGIYFYKVNDANGIVGGGKIVIE